MFMKENKTKKFEPKGKKKEILKGRKKEVLRDERLDDIVPLFTDIIGRLLATKGMLRYRRDLVVKVKSIMEGKDDKEE